MRRTTAGERRVACADRHDTIFDPNVGIFILPLQHLRLCSRASAPELNVRENLLELSLDLGLPDIVGPIAGHDTIDVAGHL